MDLALTIAYVPLVASLVVVRDDVCPGDGLLHSEKQKIIVNPWFDAARNGMARALEWCLRFKPLVLIIAVVLRSGSAQHCHFQKGLNFMDMDMEQISFPSRFLQKRG